MDKRKILTTKQQRAYEIIEDYIRRNGESPTVTELAELLGVSSLRTVTQYLESLEKKGLISRVQHQSRGIRLTSLNDNQSKTVILPVVSAAGCDNLNIFADQIFDEHIVIDRDFLNGKSDDKMVIVKAVGSSMRDANIEDGDFVLTEITKEVTEGDKIVAVINGMAIIKKIHFAQNAVILNPMSSDPNYRPIIMKEDFEVFGRVVDVIKNAESKELVYEEVEEFL